MTSECLAQEPKLDLTGVVVMNFKTRQRTELFLFLRGGLELSVRGIACERMRMLQLIGKLGGHQLS